MADTVNILSLCSGVGWLDIGIAAGLEYLGLRPKFLGHCERDAYAAACLMARMEDKSLERAPVWCGDMRDLDAGPLWPYTDIVCAGLPCPAFSVAGKQEGLADDRAWGSDDSPIPQFIRIISECRPAVVFIENVPPFVRGGFFRPVEEELCRLGYEIETPLFITAEDVGASHKRERVFIMAYAPRAGLQARSQAVGDGSIQSSGRGRNQMAIPESGRLGELRKPSRCNGQPDGGNQHVANTERSGASQSKTSRCRRTRVAVAGTSQAVADAGRSDSGSDKPQRGSDRRAVAGRDGEIVDDSPSTRSTRCGERSVESEASCYGEQAGLQRSYIGCGDVADASLTRSQGTGLAEPQWRNEPGSFRGDVPIFAPGPGDLNGWNRVVADGSFDFRAPAVKPGLRVLADGISLVVDASRADQLRCGGNGCVPLQAAVAFVELFSRVMNQN